MRKAWIAGIGIAMMTSATPILAEQITEPTNKQVRENFEQLKRHRPHQAEFQRQVCKEWERNPEVLTAFPTEMHEMIAETCVLYERAGITAPDVEPSQDDSTKLYL